MSDLIHFSNVVSVRCQHSQKKKVTDGVFKIELANSTVSPEMRSSGAILYWNVEKNILGQAKSRLTSQL